MAGIGLLLLAAANVSGCASLIYQLDVGSNRTGSSDARCPGMPIWEERFRYAATLAEAEDFKAARTLLESGLSDCDAAVRQRALAMLAQLKKSEDAIGLPQRTWRFFRPKLLDVLSALAILTAAWMIVWIPANLLNRRKILVRPLTVSNGAAFDGRHFVSIAIETHHRFWTLGQSGATLPGLSAAAPRMVMENATSAAVDTLTALTSERSGKLVMALLNVLSRPRFICSGSLHFGLRQFHIVVRLERGSRIVECWERTAPSSRLTEELKDLSFLAIQAASRRIGSRT